MKVWRRGFMRCRSRDEPCGSHQLEARALKCETSVGSTVEGEGGLCCVVGVHVKARVGGIRLLAGLACCVDWKRHCRIERTARLGLEGFIVGVRGGWMSGC